MVEAGGRLRPGSAGRPTATPTSAGATIGSRRSSSSIGGQHAAVADRVEDGRPSCSAGRRRGRPRRGRRPRRRRCSKRWRVPRSPIRVPRLSAVGGQGDDALEAGAVGRPRRWRHRWRARSASVSPAVGSAGGFSAKSVPPSGEHRPQRRRRHGRRGRPRRRPSASQPRAFAGAAGDDGDRFAAVEQGPRDRRTEMTGGSEDDMHTETLAPPPDTGSCSEPHRILYPSRTTRAGFVEPATRSRSWTRPRHRRR